MMWATTWRPSLLTLAPAVCSSKPRQVPLWRDLPLAGAHLGPEGQNLVREGLVQAPPVRNGLDKALQQQLRKGRSTSSMQSRPAPAEQGPAARPHPPGHCP